MPLTLCPELIKSMKPTKREDMRTSMRRVVTSAMPDWLGLGLLAIFIAAPLVVSIDKRHATQTDLRGEAVTKIVSGLRPQPGGTRPQGNIYGADLALGKTWRNRLLA